MAKMIFSFIFISLSNSAISQGFNPFGLFDNSEYNIFRKLEMGFTDSNLIVNNKINYSGYYVYSSSNSKYPNHTMVFYKNGLLFHSDAGLELKKNYWAWNTYRIINDTIFVLEIGGLHSLNTEQWSLVLYKVISKDTIQELTHGLTIDTQQSLAQNINRIRNSTLAYIPSNGHQFYKFIEQAELPDYYSNCKWLRKKYFWANDILFCNYIKSKK